jgi:glutathione S-transferase
VPALVCPDGLVVTEGPVILSFLADSHPSAGLIPAPGTAARARHDRWAAFLHANVYEGMLREFYPDRYVDDPALAPAVQRAATDYVQRHLSLLDAEIGAGPFLLGDRLQMVDIYLWMLSYWADADWLRANCPAIQRLKEAGDARPALAAAAQRHFG